MFLPHSSLCVSHNSSSSFYFTFPFACSFNSILLLHSLWVMEIHKIIFLFIKKALIEALFFLDKFSVQALLLLSKYKISLQILAEIMKYGR